MKICSLLVWGVIMVVCPQAAIAQNESKIKPKVEYKYYDVNIGDADKIVDQAFKATPIRQGGKKFLGETSCQTGFEYKTKNESSQCGVDDYTITLDCLITLPKFNGGGREVKEKLDAFMDRLEYHEHRHLAIFVEYAEKFDQWMTAAPQMDCNSLGNRIRSTFNQTFNECKSLQSNYDKETIHGQTEGADLQWHLASEEEKPLMAEGATAPTILVKPKIEYAHYEVAVKEDGQKGLWKRDTGRLEWSFGYSYKPRRNMDETCRVMKYEVEAVCKINLPRFVGPESLRDEMGAQEEKARNTQIERCGLVAARANKFIEDISGSKTFNCDRMANTITGLNNQTMTDIKKAIKEYDLKHEDNDIPAAPFSPAEAKISYKYYDVQIKEGDNALDQALAKTRIARNGQKSAGGLEWKWGYNYTPLKKADSNCKVAEYEINLECNITLPRFKSSDEELIKMVQPLSDKIKAEELKRCDMVKAEADKLARWLSAERDFGCNTMSNQVKAQFNQGFQAAKDEIKKYDQASTP